MVLGNGEKQKKNKNKKSYFLDFSVTVWYMYSFVIFKY